MRNFYLQRLIPFIVILLLGAYYVLVKSTAIKLTEQKLLLGTIVQIDICTTKKQVTIARKALNQTWQRIEEIDSRMSVFNEQSDVSKINRSYPSVIQIHKDTYNLLKDAEKYSRLTDGAFDITVWPLVSLWRESGEKRLIPSKEEIDRVKKSVGLKNFKLLSSYRVQMVHPQTKIDLSAIAKGYAVDEAVRILRDNGLHNFLVNAGGDLFVSGKNCQKKLWSIGIQDPKKHQKIIETLQITDYAVTTSGDYEQYYEIDGEQYSHIINPKTGYPAQKVSSATVVARSAQEADALSTALCVLGKEGVVLFDSLDLDGAALVVQKDTNNNIIEHKSQSYCNFDFRNH